jgi:hypothetical protein
MEAPPESIQPELVATKLERLKGYLDELEALS